ncbi:hypothetical protein [Brevibacillus sp. NRS-1366]|uniref:hypothetical protein n=1 Tax=Brevibacillus sp. NRS-1366 TaxID=3233899 RepID=UPI003D21DDCF
MSRVVKFIAESQEHIEGLTIGKLYAVEDNEDIVDPELEKECGCVTVWDDDGHLHEIYKPLYEFIEGVSWFSVLPKKRYLEVL